jgi:hypothetical protein
MDSSNQRFLNQEVKPGLKVVQVTAEVIQSTGNFAIKLLRQYADFWIMASINMSKLYRLLAVQRLLKDDMKKRYSSIRCQVS